MKAHARRNQKKAAEAFAPAAGGVPQVATKSVGVRHEEHRQRTARTVGVSVVISQRFRARRRFFGLRWRNFGTRVQGRLVPGASAWSVGGGGSAARLAAELAGESPADANPSVAP